MCMKAAQQQAAVRLYSQQQIRSSPAVGFYSVTTRRQSTAIHDQPVGVPYHVVLGVRGLDVKAAASFGDALPAGMRPCCMSGTLMEGTPTGVIKKVGGVDCYIKEPPAWRNSSGSGKPRVPAILVYPDIFGLSFINTQLVVDKLAEAGFLVVMVNTIKEPALPVSVMDNLLELSRPELVREPGYKPSLIDSLVNEPLKKIGAFIGLVSNFPAFLARQGGPPPKNRNMLPVIDMTLKELRAGTLGPVGKVGAVGFCFGGGFALLQGGLRNTLNSSSEPSVAVSDSDEGLVDAFMVAHTTVKVPEYITALRRPGLFIAAADDFAFPDEARDKAQVLFKDLQQPCKLVYYPGTFHGFMNRGDPRDTVIQQAQTDSIKQTVSWFSTHLA